IPELCMSYFFFSSRRRHTRSKRDWSSDVCSSDLRADNNIQLGDLVYYGPSPEYYGIGEVVRCVEGHCIVDFRGTGMLNIEKDALAMKYLIPIHKLNLGHILKST